MKEKQQLKTGYITNTDEKIIFFEDDYKFTFLRTENTITEINSDMNDFIFGKLHSRGSIAIASNTSPLQVREKQELRTWSYIVSQKINIETEPYFNMIEFRGGTLNKLFIPSALNVDREDGQSTYTYNGDSCVYQGVICDEEYEVEIASNVCEYVGIESRGIENKGVHFRIKFKNKKPIKEAYFHFQKMKQLLAFMTYREKVGFDEIFLYQGETFGQMKSMVVHINEDYEMSKKYVNQNINFHDLGDKIIPLLKILYESSDRKVSYSFDFFPKNESEVRLITSDKVKAICSALECELNFVKDIKPVENENLDELIKNVKQLISSHRESEKKLEEKTYSQIYRNIQHWKMSASDKIFWLYKKYEEGLSNVYGSIEPIMQKDIEAFVTYRNDVTHGSYRELTTEIANTAYVMSGLVYCCILKRIGFTSEEILAFCKDKLLR